MDVTFDEFSDWSGLEIRLVYYPLVSQQIPSNRAMLVIVAETRNEGNQHAAHSLGKTAVLR